MQFRFRGLWLGDAFMSPAYVRTDEDGIILSVSGRAHNGEATEAVDGYALPGFQNAHSHAFQYAMAGRAEFFPAGNPDDFWTWREAMYKVAGSLNPDKAEAIAAMVYAEMVRVGYTHVAEFHYLHHDSQGHEYENPAEMGIRMLRAAEKAGISITLIPVLYQQGGFGTTPHEGQKRFICPDVDDYQRLLEESMAAVKTFDHARIGWSMHSLRAVDPQAAEIIFRRMPDDIPFHIHAAEQKKEVSDCIDYTGQRPVQWLLDHLPVDERFFIVHATHLDEQECFGLAGSGATVVLCPGTEGNLGDGVFPFRDYAAAGGRWTIGTDSHVTLDPLQELRMIDYRQRLISNRRDTLSGDVAAQLLGSAVRNGSMAMGYSQQEVSGFFRPGRPLDAVVYDAQVPLIAAAGETEVLASIVYTADASHMLGTMRNGKWVVKSGRHVGVEEIRSEFLLAMSRGL